MFKKLVFSFLALALVVASAGTVPVPGANFKIKLAQPAVVNGIELKAGDYRLNIGDSQVTIAGNKQSVQAPAKMESGDRKFDYTAICYKTDAGKTKLSEIRLGGTRTKVVFD